MAEKKFWNYMTNEWSSECTEQRGVRWFIKAGFAGYNTVANNGWGYVSQRRAEDVVIRYQGAGGTKVKAQTAVKPESPKMYVACRQCGEVFDDLTIAHDHTGTCGSDQGWDVVTEDEAF